MSHVTQEQARTLKELGFDQNFGEEAYYRGRIVYKEDYFLGGAPAGRLYYPGEDAWQSAPSAEELMEWLKDKFSLLTIHYVNKEWHVAESDVEGFSCDELTDALYLCACWVLEGKK